MGYGMRTRLKKSEKERMRCQIRKSKRIRVSIFITSAVSRSRISTEFYRKHGKK